MRKLVVVVALLCGCAAGCAKPVAGPGQEITEGEAVLVALEHVAAMKWGERSTTLIEGKAAIAYDGEEPLSESTRGFLDQDLLQWDRFVVEPVAGQEGYKVAVRWLGSFVTWRGEHQAALGGEGLLVTRGDDGLVVERVMHWIT